MDFFQIESETITLAPNILGYIGSVPISSGVVTSVLLLFILSALAIVTQVSVKTEGTPTRVQLVFEGIYLWVLDLVEKISGDKFVAKKIIPIIFAIILFIGLSNIILIIPGLSSITYEGKDVFTTNTTSLNTTFAIASVAVVWTHFASISKFNIFNHIFKYFRIDAVIKGFKQGIGAGIMSFIDVFLGILDLISEFAKSLSLSLRLFGNMFAGEILMTLVMASFALVLPIFLTAYGAFVGILQAIVFGALVASYFGAALRE